MPGVIPHNCWKCRHCKSVIPYNEKHDRGACELRILRTEVAKLRRVARAAKTVVDDEIPVEGALAKKMDRLESALDALNIDESSV